MRYLITILALAFALPALAGVDFTGTDPTSSAIADTEGLIALDLTTIFFHINPDAITGDTFQIMDIGGLILAETMEIYLTASTLTINMNANCLLSCGSTNDARWTVPITANTDQAVCIRWDMLQSGSTDPHVWINGTDETVTQTQVGVDLEGVAVGQSLFIGANLADADAFNGEINAFALWDSDLGDDACENLTNDRTKIGIQDTGTRPLLHWRMDDVAIGSTSGTFMSNTSATSTGLILTNQGTVVGDTFLSK